MSASTQTIDINTDILSDESILWLSTASPQQISLALESGIKSYQAFSTSTLNVNNAQLPLTAPQECNWDIVEKSVERGKLAERYIVEMLQDKFGKDNVADTSKTSKSGDITLMIGNMYIMIEIKNYKSKVTQIEVDKFRRDLWVRKPHAGLFISLNSDITGIDDDFHIKYESNESAVVPCIYTVGRLSDTIYRAVLLLRQIIMSKQHLLNDVCKGELLHTKINAISDATASLTRCRSDMSENMLDIQKLLCKNWQDMTSIECTIRDSITTITEKLDLEDMEVVNVSIIDKFAPRNYTETVEIFKRIDAKNKTEPEWKSSGKKITHIGSGISLLFTKINAEIAIPTTQLSADKLSEIMTMFGAKFKIINYAVILPLEKDTIEAVYELI